MRNFALKDKMEKEKYKNWVGWEECGSGENWGKVREYDQNAMYEIPKEYNMYILKNKVVGNEKDIWCQSLFSIQTHKEYIIGEERPSTYSNKNIFALHFS